MKPPVLAFLVGFFLTALFCSLLAWVSGYNFDHRSPDVAWGIWVSFCFSVCVGFFASTFVETFE